jgi:hypothetical protein
VDRGRGMKNVHACPLEGGRGIQQLRGPILIPSPLEWKIHYYSIENKIFKVTTSDNMSFLNF